VVENADRLQAEYSILALGGGISVISYSIYLWQQFILRPLSRTSIYPLFIAGQSPFTSSGLAAAGLTRWRLPM